MGLLRVKILTALEDAVGVGHELNFPLLCQVGLEAVFAATVGGALLPAKDSRHHFILSSEVNR